MPRSLKSGNEKNAKDNTAVNNDWFQLWMTSISQISQNNIILNVSNGEKSVTLICKRKIFRPQYGQGQFCKVVLTTAYYRASATFKLWNWLNLFYHSYSQLFVLSYVFIDVKSRMCTNKTANLKPAKNTSSLLIRINKWIGSKMLRCLGWLTVWMSQQTCTHLT